MVFYNISHNIFGIISSKYFLLCFLIYCIVFHNVLRYVYHSISLKYFVLFFLIYFTIFVNIASNVPYAGQSLSHCFLRALFRTAIARRLLAALLAMPAPTSSSARSSLIIAHSCFVSRSMMSRSLFSCFSILTAWGACSARDTE